MEDTVLPSSEQRSPDNHRTIPKRPRKTPILPTSSARISALRVVGQELNRLKEDELVSSLNRNSEGPCESATLASIDDTSEQTDRPSELARHADAATLSRDQDHFTPSRFLDVNLSVQLSRKQDGDDDESEMSLSPEAEYLRLPANASANVLESQESPPEGAFLSSCSGNGDWHPERIFGEDTEQNQRMSPSTTVKQQWRSSTHFPVGEHASRPNDLDVEDTWRIPSVGGNSARWSLFKSVWSWLKGFPPC
jgi:hypothetical protein